MTPWGKTGLFTAACLVVLLVCAIFQVDHDPGPAKGQRYPRWDRWSYWHLIGSGLIAFVACWWGVPWLLALGITVAAGIGWEVVNGYFDWYDVLWDFCGAFVGVALCLLVH